MLATQAKAGNLVLASTDSAFAQFEGVVVLGLVATAAPPADSDDTLLGQTSDFALFDEQLACGIPLPCGYIHGGSVDRPTGSGHWLPRLIQPDLGS